MNKKRIMNGFKKVIALSIIIICCLSLFIPLKSINTNAISEAIINQRQMGIKNDENDYKEQFIINNNISRTMLLYNYDGSPDYTYVSLNNGGYAIFANGSNELLEYSPQSSVFDKHTEPIIYGGPNNYYINSNNVFTDLISREEFTIGSSKIKDISLQLRSLFNINADSNFIQENRESIISNNIIEKNEPKDIPALDENNLISPTAGATYVAHEDYFLADPTHGANNGTSCTTVATQLMLSYNNYYKDRRLIPDNYLNGTQYVNNNDNPNYCTDPLLFNSKTLGSNQAFHDYLFDKGVTSFPKDAKEYLDDYLQERNSELIDPIEYTLKCEHTYPNVVSVDNVLAELNADRPIVMSTEHRMNGTTDSPIRRFNHSVLAYGYQYLAPYSDGTTYLGYIVHFGWGANTNQIWTNSAWYYTYLSLDINHSHSYNTVGVIDNTGRTEYKCETCGHRTDAVMNIPSNSRYEEKVVSLLNTNGYRYKDYYITFNTTGNKMFQTFGMQDTKLSLYDFEYNRLDFNDDSGYGFNSLFSYSIQANVLYILRVEFYNPTIEGETKIGITAADGGYNYYEGIVALENNPITTQLSLNTTKVLTYTPIVSGMYVFELDSDFDNYLYVIDPRSSELIVSNLDYNDDGGVGFNAQISRYLEADISYFIIICKYNPNSAFNETDNKSIQIKSSMSGLPIVSSNPSYLRLELIERSGFIIYNWTVKIVNPNSYTVQVTYNSKMCFEQDAKNYTNLNDLVTIYIPANSSKTIQINGNGTAGWITTCINYTIGSGNYRRVTCGNGLNVNLSMNTPVNRQITYV